MEGTPDVNVQGAEPSSAATVTETLANLSPEAYAEWRKTGEIPTPPAVEDSATSKEPEAKEPTGAETDNTGQAKSAAESVTAKTQESRKGKPTAEERIRQLSGKAKDLERQLAEERAKNASPKVEVKQESVKEKTAEAAAKPGLRAKPRESDKKEDGTLKYATYDAFLEDRDTWIEEKTAHDIAKALESDREKRKQESAEAESNKQAEQQKKIFTERITAAKAKHDDFEEVAFDPEVQKIIPLNSAVDRFILKSPLGLEILYHLASDRDELTRILALDDFEQSAELVAIAKSLNGDSKKPPSEETPVIKTTAAKRPGPEASGRNTPPPDPSKAAVANRDFTAFHAAENAKEWAKRKKT